MSSIHPFEPFIPDNATKLIIGTIPPPRFCKNDPILYEEDVNFYYGSRDNKFWKLLEEISGENLSYNNSIEAINERKFLLTKLGIGITDIIESCLHINDSAEDKNLNLIKLKDLKNLLTTNSNIDTLIYTSEFVKKLMNQLFKTYHTIELSNRKKQTIKLNGKVYKVLILFSPSPSALRGLGQGGSIKRIEQYRHIFTTD